MADAEYYRLHGLLVRSEVPLPEQPAAPGLSDLEVYWDATCRVGPDPPEGEMVAEAVTDTRRWYTIVRTDADYVLRFHGTCDIHLSWDLKIARCAMDIDADARLATVLVGGTLLAFVLQMAGHCVLHASAVQLGERDAVAFVGASGMGKTTAAALLCVAGSPLVTDDVLRVDFEDDAICHRGASAVRLRPGAKSVLVLRGEEDGTTVAATADERVSWRPLTSTLELLRLAAVVVPRPRRELTDPQVNEVSAAESLSILLRFPRVYGMRRPEDVVRQFDQFATLATRVPVMIADIPWGPPFSLGVAQQLRSQLSALLASRRAKV